MNKISLRNKKDQTVNCLPTFSHINHYWDRARSCVIAKILPGEFYMTKENVTIATTLGSCISACIWDSRNKIGGMNHFMLPITDKDKADINWGNRALVSDANRYGNFAMENLINEVLKHGGQRINLKAKVFGGGQVLSGMTDIGERNIHFVEHYLANEGIEILTSDIGLTYPRKVLFEPLTGRAFVKRLDSLHNDTIYRRETDYSNSIEKDSVDGDVELF